MGRVAKEHEESLRQAGNWHYFDCGDGFMSTYVKT